jgi:hypothetical protein
MRKKRNRELGKLLECRIPPWTDEIGTSLFNVLVRAVSAGVIPDLEIETIRARGGAFWSERPGVGQRALQQLERQVGSFPDPLPGMKQRERNRCVDICRSIASMCRAQLKASVAPDAREYHRHGMEIAELCAVLIIQEGREVDGDYRMDAICGAPGSVARALTADVPAPTDGAEGAQHVRGAAS